MDEGGGGLDFEFSGGSELAALEHQGAVLRMAFRDLCMTIHRDVHRGEVKTRTTPLGFVEI